MVGYEKFRVFRHDENGRPEYIGTYAEPSVKDAIKKAIYADGDGKHVYEAHVLRNASLHDGRSRKEHFIDSLTPLNTQQFFSDNPPT